MSFKVVVVGGGECGVRAALALRRNGHDGPIHLISSEPHSPYERPPLSKEAITSSSEPLPKFVAADDQLAQGNVAFEREASVQSVELADRSVVLADGRAYRFDKLLLATGARARTLAGVGPERTRVRTLRTFADALSLRELAQPHAKVLVVGAGFIGLEVAASCRARGCDVEVVESTTRLMGRIVPEHIGIKIAHRHAQAGVSIKLDVRVEKLSQVGQTVEVELSDGRSLSVDLVVVGIGAEPEIELAAKAGLKIDNGIAVNDKLETEVKGVFSGGDCCSFPMELYGGKRVRLEAWRNAQLHGELIAKNMLGECLKFGAVPWFWSDQFDLTLQIAGLPGEGVETVVRRLSHDAELCFHLDANGRIVAATGLGVGNAVARDIRLSEMLIARRRQPTRAQLEAVDTSLKSLL